MTTGRLGAALLVALAILTGALPAQARPIPHWRERQCRFARYDGRGGFTRHEIELTIACAARRWDPPGEVRGSRCIADHESGDDPHDVNASSGAAGVYQWIPYVFAEAVRHHHKLVRRWNLSRSVFNARSNVVFAIRIASETSWRPGWTTAAGCGLP